MINLIFLSLFFVQDYDIPSGSIFFMEGGNILVQEVTDSSITHVGIIIKENDSYYVYEAVRPKVRKVLLNDYLKDNENKIYIAKLKSNYQIDHLKMKEYLDSQIGIKYSIKNYNKNKSDGKTIFCSQLVAECYNMSVSDRLFVNDSQKYAPVDIWKVMINYSKIERLANDKD